MKNVKFLFLVSLLFVSMGIHAQNLRFGLKTGPIISSSFHRVHHLEATDVKFADPNPAVGFHINGILEHKFSEKFGVQLEPGFIRKVWKDEAVNIEPFQVDYLQMPIVFGYYFTDNLVASLGVDIGYHLKKRKFDVVDEFDFGGLLGMRYDITDQLGVGLRYSRAFTPYLSFSFTDANGDDAGSVEYFSHYLQFSVAYRI